MNSVTIFVLLVLSVLKIHSEILIDDFREIQNTSAWFEWSDTVRPEGKSKASLVIQKTDIFQRAILFTLLNPLGCGAAIADTPRWPPLAVLLRARGDLSGVYTLTKDNSVISNRNESRVKVTGVSKNVSMDWSNGTAILLNISNQGQYNGYEFFLRHRGDSGIEVHSYIQYFKAPQNKFETISLPFDKFQPYRKGKFLKSADPLDKSNITQIGLLTYGGIHKKKKQRGVASLEIDWMKVV